MSNVFGVPPPPQPRVVQPAQQRPATEPPDAPVAWTEPDRGRRRWALVAGFLAVVLLAIANLAIWLNFSALRPAQAGPVAEATYATVSPQFAEPVEKRLGLQVRTRASGSLNAAATPERVSTADPSVGDDIRAAVSTVLASDQARTLWEQSVADGLASGRESLGSGDSDVSVTFSLNPLAAAAATQLRAQGYGFFGNDFPVGTYEADLVDASGDLATVGGLAPLWGWLLAGSIACAVASFALATRRLRLGFVLALDAAVLFTLLLLLVLVSRAFAGNDVVDEPVRAAVLEDAYRVITRGLVVQTAVIAVLAACVAVALGLLARSRDRSEARRSADGTAA